jgi:hypothetical protein
MLARGGGQTLASHQPILWFPKSAFPLARRLERSIEKLLVTSAHQNHTHTISGFQPGRIRLYRMDTASWIVSASSSTSSASRALYPAPIQEDSRALECSPARQ